MAKTTPPMETMLAAAAPVDSGTLAEEVPLAAEPVEAEPEPVPVALLGAAELAAGTLVLPAGAVTEVTRVGTAAEAELTAAGTELTAAEGDEMTDAWLVKGCDELMLFDLPAGRETGGIDVAPAGVETAGAETAGAVGVAGGAWI